MSNDVRAFAAGTAAVFAAALTGAVLLAWPSPDPFSIFFLATYFGLPIAALHAALVAAPVYWFAGQRWKLNRPRAALGGLGVGAGPALAIALLDRTTTFAFAFPIVTGGAVSGLAGGLVFRAIRGPRPPALKECAS